MVYNIIQYPSTSRRELQHLINKIYWFLIQTFCLLSQTFISLFTISFSSLSPPSPLHTLLLDFSSSPTLLCYLPLIDSLCSLPFTLSLSHSSLSFSLLSLVQSSIATTADFGVLVVFASGGWVDFERSLVVVGLWIQWVLIQ